MNDKVYGDKRIYWVWLVQVCGVGSSAVWKLRKKYPSIRSCVEAVLNGTETDLTDAASAKAGEITLGDSKKLIDTCESNGVSVIYIDDEEYPKKLKELPEPPPVLFVVGDPLSLDSKYTVAIAGARDPDSHSLEAVDLICKQLAAEGVMIVTGLERGIDIAAARAASAHGAVHTGISGRGIFCEKEAADLVSKCGSSEIMLSEYTSINDFGAVRFAARNRILCGLADAVIFVQCAADSKGLKIAQTARKMGKPVLVVPPANIASPRYFGQRDLIRKGAVPYFDADDLFNVIKAERGGQTAARRNTDEPDTSDISQEISDTEGSAAKPALKTSDLKKPAAETDTPDVKIQTGASAPAAPAGKAKTKSSAKSRAKSKDKEVISPEVEAVRENVKNTLKEAIDIQKQELEGTKTKQAGTETKQEEPKAEQADINAEEGAEREKTLAETYEEFDALSKTVYQLIKKEPGININMICLRLDLKINDVAYSVVRLRFAGLLTENFGYYRVVEF